MSNATSLQGGVEACSTVDYDLVVIGAGPAGMSAAIAGGKQGMRVLLLDEQDAVGGQIYRGITQTDSRRLEILGADYAHGATIASALDASAVTHWPHASVWQVTRERMVHVLRNGVASAVQAGKIIIATGAMERPFPMPGWTLPGVMTAGAAQILLKTASVTPTKPVVLAGCGPLLYLLADQYLRAGVQIKAIVDTTAASDYGRAMRYAVGALLGRQYVRKGLGLLRTIKASKTPFYKSAKSLRIEGESHATAISFISGGQQVRLDTDLVLLHQGVVPNTQISWSLRAEHEWDEFQLCWRPVVDSWGALDVPGIYVAGDGATIGGARVAAIQGQLTGLAAAHAAGACTAQTRDGLAQPFQAELRQHLHIRPFLDTLYQPKVENRIPADSVTVCRCEEVSAGAIREYVALGCAGPNQAKSFGRCGMGPCQGRLCGLTVTEIIAQERGVSPTEVGYYRIRSPIKPITLAELAQGS